VSAGKPAESEVLGVLITLEKICSVTDQGDLKSRLYRDVLSWRRKQIWKVNCKYLKWWYWKLREWLQQRYNNRNVYGHKGQIANNSISNNYNDNNNNNASNNIVW